MARTAQARNPALPKHVLRTTKKNQGPAFSRLDQKIADLFVDCSLGRVVLQPAGCFLSNQPSDFLKNPVELRLLRKRT
jgi:hypothetical protein